MQKLILLALASFCAVLPAQQAKHIPAPGGEVAITSDTDQRAYDDYHYAPVRRAGSYVYVSGVVVRRPESSPNDVQSFKAAARVVFKRIAGRLAAEGVNFSDVVMINSFHVWDGPDFVGTKNDQFKAFSEVKDEFMTAPYPAWTAVGTTGLLGEHSIVEVQMIAYAPKKPRAK